MVKVFTATLWEPRSQLSTAVTLSNSRSRKAPLYVTPPAQLAPMTSELSPLFWAGTMELTEIMKVFKELSNKSPGTHFFGVLLQS